MVKQNLTRADTELKPWMKVPSLEPNLLVLAVYYISSRRSECYVKIDMSESPSVLDINVSIATTSHSSNRPRAHHLRVDKMHFAR